MIERRPENVALATEQALAAERPGLLQDADDIERNVILEALTYHQGNRTDTAKALGISIRTLRTSWRIIAGLASTSEKFCGRGRGAIPACPADFSGWFGDICRWAKL